jgi:hypothetical protein
MAYDAQVSALFSPMPTDAERDSQQNLTKKSNQVRSQRAFFHHCSAFLNVPFSLAPNPTRSVNP